jgi:hypothetical protein
MAFTGKRTAPQTGPARWSACGNLRPCRCNSTGSAFGGGPGIGKLHKDRNLRSPRPVQHVPRNPLIARPESPRGYHLTFNPSPSLRNVGGTSHTPKDAASRLVLTSAYMSGRLSIGVGGAALFFRSTIATLDASTIVGTWGHFFCSTAPQAFLPPRPRTIAADARRRCARLAAQRPPKARPLHRRARRHAGCVGSNEWFACLCLLARH